ncbi:hypothetical protein F4818DRAFT_118038 [Hypoxylon cercidicola]|nr:hypothetical protein F4818DRAFT_118038 [Hypoxylon cercidicola]
MTRLSWTAPLLAAAALANVTAGLSLAARNHSLPHPTWQLLPTGSSACFRGLTPVSDKIAWVSGVGGTVLLTTDGGRTWASVGPAATDTALAVGPSGSDFTLDGGKFWHRSDSGSFDSVKCVKGPVCWAYGENGGWRGWFSHEHGKLE